MARPPRTRRVARSLTERVFKPRGRTMGELDEVRLSLDELEALRLADLEGLYQAAAAEHMKVSRATFARILMAARSKVAGALVEGHALRIEGGEVTRDASTRVPCPLHQDRERRGRACRCRRGRDARPEGTR